MSGIYVPIELDKSRRLRYRYNDVADIEEKSGLGIAAMFDINRAGFHTIRVLIWGGLKWEDRGLTIQRTGDIIQQYLDNGGTLDSLMNSAMTALERGGIVKYQEEEDTEGNPEPGEGEN